jgi:hypothetical protein
VPVKRYPELFASIKKFWKGDLKFAIICSQWASQTSPQETLAEYDLVDEADVFTDIGQSQVNLLLNQSKCHVLFSLREGANRASFESILTGTPALVPSKHIGFPRARFNQPHVFYFRSNRDLIKVIQQIAVPAEERKNNAFKALSLTGSQMANDILEQELKLRLLGIGEDWNQGIIRTFGKVQKCYENKDDVSLLTRDYQFISECSFNNFYKAELAIEYLSGKTHAV